RSPKRLVDADRVNDEGEPCAPFGSDLTFLVGEEASPDGISHPRASDRQVGRTPSRGAEASSGLASTTSSPCRPAIALSGLAKMRRTSPAIPVTFATAAKSSPTPSPWNPPAARPAIRLPSAVPMNQVPINWPTRLRGASLVTLLKPTGERQSSPTVWKK